MFKFEDQYVNNQIGTKILIEQNIIFIIKSPERTSMKLLQLYNGKLQIIFRAVGANTDTLLGQYYNDDFFSTKYLISFLISRYKSNFFLIN